MSLKTPEAVAISVRRARVRRSWSQSDLARKIGVTREWVGRLEMGAPRLEFDKVLRAMTVLGLRIEAPHDEVATSADIEQADEIAWTMALEDRKLTRHAYDKLLNTVISERLSRERTPATG